MEHDVMQQAEEWVRKIMTRETQAIDPYNDMNNPGSPLNDFTRGFKGVGNGVPAAYAQECLAYERRHQNLLHHSLLLV